MTIGLQTPNFSNAFPAKPSSLLLEWRVFPQNIFKDTNALTRAISSELNKHTRTGDKNQRLQMLQISGLSETSPFCYDNKKENFSICSAVGIVSQLLICNNTLRRKCNEQLTGKVPTLFQVLNNQVRTGKLGRTNDRVSSVTVDSSYSDWVLKEGLSNTIFDINYLLTDEGFAKAISFLSMSVDNKYVPSTNFVVVKSDLDNQVTLCGLSSNGESIIRAHSGIAVPADSDIPELHAAIEFIVQGRLYRMDKVSQYEKYNFSDSARTRETTLPFGELVHFALDVIQSLVESTDVKSTPVPPTPKEAVPQVEATSITNQPALMPKPIPNRNSTRNRNNKQGRKNLKAQALPRMATLSPDYDDDYLHTDGFKLFRQLVRRLLT